MKNKISHIFNMMINYLNYAILKVISKKPIRVYYWKGHPNFGDLITPSLLEYYGYTPIFFYPNRAQLVATGSLIEHINKDYKGVIFGTGAISASTSIEFKNAQVIGLRGALTKKALHIENDIIYGDPGLLASKLLKVRNNKKFKIGLMPHYKDIGNTIVDKLEEKFKDDITIIDVQEQPLNVLNKMDECEYILSSSLHGLICADSLGIPNGWVPFSDLMGGDFKFRDYYTVFGLKPKPNIMTGDESIDNLIGYTSQIPLADVEKVKKDLEQGFINLSRI
jgi:pyruvyltransferase